MQDGDYTKLGRQPGVLGRMLELGDPHCTHALSYVLMSRLARCTLGLQRKMHSEAEAQIGRRKTAHTKALFQRPISSGEIPAGAVPKYHTKISGAQQSTSNTDSEHKSDVTVLNLFWTVPGNLG